MRFPNFRTVVTTEAGPTGEVTIETLCMTDDDANKDNVFKLPQIILDKRSVINIDISTGSWFVPKIVG